MDAQPAGTFDKQAFIAAVKAAIEAKSPKTLEEADAYRSSGKAGEVKDNIKGLVTQGKQGQAKDIEAATAAPPDTSNAIPKPVTPMAEEQPGQVAAIPAAGAVPKTAPAEQVNLAAGKHEADQELADADVSEPQLARSNEPEFQQALTDKQAAAAHADTAPGEFRQQEQQVLTQSRTEAAAQTTAGVAGMQGAKGAALAALVAGKGKAKSKDEAKRAEVTGKIQGLFAATEADVRKLLDGIDAKVEAEFNTGEAGARTAFETFVATKMAAYKKDRYGGWLGGFRWAKDKLFGMPAKVDEFYRAGRELYLQRMDGVISRVATIVGGELTAAKQRIARGRTEITAYVQSLPTDLKKVGAEASKEIGDRFSQLESDVDAKQESVVDTLATKYVDARKGLDERIEALQAENKGLVDKAIGAIKAVINTIRELVAMLKNVLSRAAGVVGEIIKNPIGFLGNLIAGVKGGILKFKENIVDHLRKGLMGWLFGALAEGGVELPETFDVKGIIRLLASIFGLTWANIRNRIVRQIGAPAMAAVEKGVTIFQILAAQGVGGLWEMLLEKLGDIKEMILEKVRDFVEEKIIAAGITWLIGLLNPAAAFIKACKLIYDVVMFFVTNAGRIARFVDTILDSVADIVRGNVGGVINKINDVLGQMLPIIIGFLASVIGLGGIGQKIRSIVETLQKPVNQALDFVIKTGLKLAGPVIRGIAGISGRVKAKVAAGKAWVKGKAEAGMARLRGEDVRSLARRRVLAAFQDGASVDKVRGDLPAIRADLAPRGLKRLELGPVGPAGAVDIMAEASPFDRLVSLIPRYLKKREDDETGKLKEGTPYVTMKITLTLADATDQLPAEMRGRRPSGSQVARDEKGQPLQDSGGRYVFADAVYEMPGVELDKSAKPKRGRALSSTQQRSGGLIEPPKPGEKTLRMVTFNTAEGSSVQSNATHAERQLASWLQNVADDKWRSRIQRIAAEINYSPCTLCSVDLKTIAVLTPNADAASRLLSWTRPYIDKKRQGADNRSTTNASLGEIASAGWTVTPNQVGDLPVADKDDKLLVPGKR
ncbi:hypothetical protein AB0C29_33705 [Actinoplanes sp. NPDC048791]|uniref:phage tail protein n=1 Tax=Actinoplanes sp. NPDC048791 TaxID=3154623 RepID=UPI0034022F0C